MCYPKPRARCSNSIDKQYKSLHAQKLKIKEKLETLSQSITASASEKAEAEFFLNQINLEIEKNRIDWAASKEGQITFERISTTRKKTFDEALQQHLGTQRKMFQDMAYKKISQTETSYSSPSEGFWACKNTGVVIINGLHYEIAALKAKEQNFKNKLMNIDLPPQSREEAIRGLKETHKKILLNELNLSDMESFLADNEEKYLHSYAQAV